jgi:hypothetical protein
MLRLPESREQRRLLLGQGRSPILVPTEELAEVIL